MITLKYIIKIRFKIYLIISFKKFLLMFKYEFNNENIQIHIT